MKIIHNRSLLLAISLIHSEKKRTPRLAQQSHQFKVGRRYFRSAIHYHHDCRRFVERTPGLSENLRRNKILVLRNDSAGVDNSNAAPAPLRIAIQTVPRDAGFVADNRAPRSHNPVEQGGLAYVRSAHDRKRWNARCCGGDSARRVVSGLSQNRSLVLK